MAIFIRSTISILVFGAVFSAVSCSAKVESNQNTPAPAVEAPSSPTPQAVPQPTSAIPNLQAEIRDRSKTTSSPIGKFDFKNYDYELPRGWQNPDGSTGITLTNGRIAPIEGKTNTDEMTGEEKADAKSRRRIGLSYVTTKYLDVTGDGEDEAVVVLKIETGGNAIPQVVYVFTWKNGAPELIWPFRTGDRADGGLKDIRAENGMLVVELYGQDRFLLGQTETGKIGDDREQLCCPTHFTRSTYKWNGNSFLLTGKRLTFLVANPAAPPIENLGEKVNAKQKTKK